MVDPHIYQLVVEQAKDYAVFVLDPNGCVLTWNLGARRIKGYEPEEIIGRHFSTFYTREAVDAGSPARGLSVAAAEGWFEDEGWRVRKDGSRFWASVVITALRDPNGALIGYSKITRDLTERKRQQEALRQSEERFRLLIEGVTEYAMYMLDPDGIVTTWNTGGERIKGYRPDEIIGKHVSILYVAEDVVAGTPSQELAAARRTGRVETEGWRRKKNGDHFWARVIMRSLYDADGRLRGFAKVTQDLSERRHLQDLEEAAKNLNEFIAMLAHELRNPLAPIRAAVHVMAKSPAGDPAHDIMRATIDRQSALLVRIVDDMLDIARVTRGALSIEERLVDIADVVRRALETSGPAIQAGKQTVNIDVPTDRVLVQGDVQRLTQLVANLLNNSARYTPAGGTIAISARAESSWAILTVRDNGRGIEPALMARIFDMFVQGREPLQRVGGGLGIGLALARRIAELHGGTLEAHSEGENKGAEFTLRMPLSRTADTALEAMVEPATAAPPGKQQRVLVVDDNVDAATALDLMVRLLGHDVRMAHDGEQALQMAVDFGADIVLLDIGMPGLDGYEVARRLRGLNKDRPCRIVAVTGWGKEADRRRSGEAGIDVHLTKPIDIKDLAQVLDPQAIME